MFKTDGWMEGWMNGWTWLGSCEVRSVKVSSRLLGGVVRDCVTAMGLSD